MSKHFPSFILSAFLLVFICASCDSTSATESAAPDATPTAKGLEIKNIEGFSHKVELPTPNPDATPIPVSLPGKADIVLWLDATEGLAVDGSTLTWTDKINGTQFKLEGQQIENGINGKPVVRISGDSGISFDAGLDLGPYMVFIVYQRETGQTDGPDSQRLLSVWDGTNPEDTYLPSFAHPIERGDEVIQPSLLFEEIQYGGRERFAIGMNATSDVNNFHGDIAEVIIYHKTFVLPEPLDDIQNYLGNKWGVEYTSLVGWTQFEEMGDSVARSNHNYPLSDQDNTEGWVLYEPWSDEFDDGILDTQKWLPHNHEWYGRQPARFLPENISEGSGTVKLAMKKDTTLPVEDLYGTGVLYENYSSATLQSLTAKRFGYFEIRARAGVGSSAFWLYAETYRDNLHNKLEIDIYEIGGLERGYEELYNMNTWVWIIDGTPIIFDTGGKWNSGIPFADDFHVFGFKWTAETLEYYVDGVLVRSMPNRHYHSPLILLFDTETMPVWFGVPPDDHLPAYHEIDYMRAWTNAETVDTWEGDYVLMYDPRFNNPTAEYVSQFPGHVDEGIPGPMSDRVFCSLLPTWVDSASSYTFDLEYSAAEGEKDIQVEFWSADSLLGQEQITLPGGSSGTTSLSIDLSTAPPEGLDYQIKASMRPTGTGEPQNLDFCFAELIVGDRIPVTGLKISPALKSLQPGETWALISFVYPSNATNLSISWRSTDEAVATVDADGLVTAVSEGMVTILATTLDGEFTAQSAIIVTPVQSGLIQNPGFESSELHPWTSYGEISIGNEYAHTGAYGVAITGVGAVEQLVSIEPDTTYQLSGFAKVLEEGHQVFFGVKGYEDDAEVYTDVKIADTSYSEASLTFTSGPGNSTALVYYYVKESGHQAFGDDYEFVKVE